MFARLITRLIYEESGQAVTEYGAILAFVTLLIALAFAAGADFRTALMDAYNAITNQLMSLNNAVSLAPFNLV